MKTKRRLFCQLLCGAILFSFCFLSAFARAQAQDSEQIAAAGGLCEHHSQHTEDCGFAGGDPGTACSFVCEICSNELTTTSIVEKAVTMENSQSQQMEDISSTGLAITSENVGQMGTFTAGNGTVVVEHEGTTVTITMTDASMTGPMKVKDLNAVIKLHGANHISYESETSAVYVENGALTIEASDHDSGSLEASGNAYAIYASNGISIADTTITATARQTAAIQANDAISIAGSTVRAICPNESEYGTYGIYVYGGGADKGNISISNSVVTINCSVTAVYTEGTLTVSGSEIGMDGSNPGTVLLGTRGVTIDNSKINADCTNVGISSGNKVWNNDGGFWETSIESDIVVNGGTVQLNSATSNAFYATGRILIKDGAAVGGQCFYPVLYADGEIQISASTVNTDSTEDCGIVTNGSLTIDQESNVTAKGAILGIGAQFGVTVTDSKVDAYGANAPGIFTGGDISFSGTKTNVNVESAGDDSAINCSNFNITGGEVTISNQSEYAPCVNAYGMFKISGGKAAITASEYIGINLSSGSSVEISGGELTVNSKEVGINTPNDNVKISAGKLNITSSEGVGIQGKSIEISGGEVSVEVADKQNPFFLDNGDNLVFTGGTLTLPNAANNKGIFVGDKTYYLVTFDAQNGTKPESVLIEDGNKLSHETPQKGNYIFAGWYDAPTDGDKWNLEEKTVTAHMNLYAQWAAPQYSVTVQAETGGTASASPASAEQGTEITLTATPDSDYHFKEWQVISGGVTISNNRFTMPDSNVTLKAVFEQEITPPPTKYNVTIQIEGNGTASASLTSAEQGTEITLTAAPDSGYHFKEWQVISGGVTISNNRFTMPNSNVAVKAVFEQDITPPLPTKYSIIVQAGTGGAASASLTSADQGTEVTLTATANNGYHFKEWQVISGGVTISNNRFTMPDSNVTLKAVFEQEITPPPTKYNVTIQIEGNGTASASLTSAEQGTEITLTATSDSGYHFKEWQVISGGVTISSNRFTMPDANVTVKAVFVQDSPTPQPAKYSVTIQTEGSGTASASPTTAQQGTEITLTASPGSGCHLKEWLVISGGVTISNNRFTMPDSNVTLKAVFEQDITPPLPTKYDVTIQIEGSGTAFASPASAEQGTEITLTATPDSGYHFKEWQVISGGVTINNNRFTMPDSNVAVKSVFEQNSGGDSSGGNSSSDGNNTSGGGEGFSTPVYGKETLSNGGVILSGDRIHKYARLTVTKDRLHNNGDCGYCGQIRQWQEQGRILAVYDVSLSHGFRGAITITFPVPNDYDGKTLTVVHCLKYRLDTYDVAVSNGEIKVTVDSLSPFAILDKAKDKPDGDNLSIGSGTSNPFPNVKSPKTGDNGTAGATDAGGVIDTADIANLLAYSHSDSISLWEVIDLCALPTALIMSTAAVIYKRRRKTKAETAA